MQQAINDMTIQPTFTEIFLAQERLSKGYSWFICAIGSAFVYSGVHHDYSFSLIAGFASLLYGAFWHMVNRPIVGVLLDSIHLMIGAFIFLMGPLFFVIGDGFSSTISGSVIALVSVASGIFLVVLRISRQSVSTIMNIGSYVGGLFLAVVTVLLLVALVAFHR